MILGATWTWDDGLVTTGFEHFGSITGCDFPAAQLLRLFGGDSLQHAVGAGFHDHHMDDWVIGIRIAMIANGLAQCPEHVLVVGVHVRGCFSYGGVHRLIDPDDEFHWQTH